MKTTVSLKTAVTLLTILFVTALAYIPGLSGEFIFDDHSNFENLERWVTGETNWRQVVFSHEAGPLGRPLAMATFLANTAISGVDPFAFKLTNLVLHLVIGVFVFAVARRLALRDRRLTQHAEMTGLAIAAVWLLHPIMVGTVLYAVQRMAMLAALFMLLAVLAYLHGRELLKAGRARRGALWIFIGVPAFTILGAFSKENALLAPLVCVVIELALFRPAHDQPRPTPARVFLAAGGALPLAVAVGIMIINPSFYFDGFASRPFTPLERLLTQARVIFDYVGQLLLPRGPQMSLLRDDYSISTSFFSPWTTLIAWLGWLVIVALAFVARNRVPLFTAGIAIFLVGHSMESSIFPLLIYFEHRNYFPSVGLLLAVAAALAWAWEYVRPQLTSPQRWSRLSMLGLAIALSAATFARASVWHSNETMLEQQLRFYPDSRTLRMALAQIKMNHNPPLLGAAQKHYRYLMTLDRPSTQLIGAAGILASDCYAGNSADQNALALAFSEPLDEIEADLISAIESLVQIVRTKECEDLSASLVAGKLTQMLTQSNVEASSKPHWQLRYRAAQLYDDAKQPKKALKQLKIAWQPGTASPPVGIMMVRILSQLQRNVAAERLLQEIEPQIPEYDQKGQALIEQYRQAIERQRQNKKSLNGRLDKFLNGN